MKPVTLAAITGIACLQSAALAAGTSSSSSSSSSPSPSSSSYSHAYQNPFPVQFTSQAIIDSQSACTALAQSIPLALANIAKSSKYDQEPLTITSIITKLYAEGSNPTSMEMLNDIPKEALGYMASVTLQQVSDSVGDWDSNAIKADMGYGLQDDVQSKNGGLPSFCRFGASIKTSNTSATWFETWMPVPGVNSTARTENGTTGSTSRLSSASSSSTSSSSVVLSSLTSGQSVFSTSSTRTRRRRAKSDLKTSSTTSANTSSVQAAATRTTKSSTITSATTGKAATSTSTAGNSTLPHTVQTGRASHKNWYGRLIFVGSAAQRGAPAYPEMKQVIARYREATASSNLGHFGTGGSTDWAVGHPEAQFDFGYRGTHVAAFASQYVVQQYYGVQKSRTEQSRSQSQKRRDTSEHNVVQKRKKHEQRSSSYSPRLGFPAYYKGCSTGGRQGMVEAQRFPYDFDGIMAGSPAVYYNELNAYQIHVNGFQHDKQSAQYIPTKLYSVIHDFILQQCDTLDGLRDAVIENPSICKPDFMLLQCDPRPTTEVEQNIVASAISSIFGSLFGTQSSGNGTNSSSMPSTGSSTYAPAGKCLTTDQIANLRNIYTDYKFPNGTVIHEGVLYGSESYWTVNDGVVGTAFPPAPGWYHDQVLNITGPASDFDYFSVVDNNFTLIDFAHRLNPGQTESNNANLGRYFARGGKLLHYHGLADQLIPSGSSDRFYSRIKANTGVSSDQYQYVKVPGMAHCRSGDGAWNFGGAGQTVAGSRPYKYHAYYDMLLALFEWVENGHAPQNIIGAAYKFVANGNEALNATSTPSDVQTYAKGLKFLHRLCPFPQKLHVENNSTSTGSQYCA